MRPAPTLNSKLHYRTAITMLSEDALWLRTTYAEGWTGKVRSIIHEHVKNAKEQPQQHPLRLQKNHGRLKQD